MPYQTFFNLPEKKSKKIIRAAVEEFAARGYQGSSVQNIADRAGVAKGSIYQYFLNKKELFLYIFDLAVEEKIAYVNRKIKENQNMPFFRLLEELFLDAARKAVLEPELYQLYSNLLSGVSAEIREEIQSKVDQAGKEYYSKLLGQAADNGEIRDDISLELAVFVVYTSLRDFGELFGSRLAGISWESLQGEVHQLIEVLKNGLLARKE